MTAPKPGQIITVRRPNERTITLRFEAIDPRLPALYGPEWMWLAGVEVGTGYSRTLCARRVSDGVYQMMSRADRPSRAARP